MTNERINVFSSYSPNEEESIREKLKKKLEYHEIKQRPGANGVKLAYLEGWKAYSLANEVFGFNGWSSEILNMQTDFIDEQDHRISVGISCTVRIYLKDGTFHDDVGYGSSENQRSKSMAICKAKKEAVTDATKRALRCFGNRLGNCMYDKDFLKELSRSANSIRQPMPNITENKPLIINTNEKRTYSHNPQISSVSLSKTTQKSISSMVDISLDNTLIHAEDDYEDMDALLIEAVSSSECLTRSDSINSSYDVLSHTSSRQIRAISLTANENKKFRIGSRINLNETPPVDHSLEIPISNLMLTPKMTRNLLDTMHIVHPYQR